VGKESTISSRLVIPRLVTILAPIYYCLMPKMSHPGKNHGNIMLIRRLN